MKISLFTLVCFAATSVSSPTFSAPKSKAPKPVTLQENNEEKISCPRCNKKYTHRYFKRHYEKHFPFRFLNIINNKSKVYITLFQHQKNKKSAKIHIDEARLDTYVEELKKIGISFDKDKMLSKIPTSCILNKKSSLHQEVTENVNLSKNHQDLLDFWAPYTDKIR